MCPCAQATPVRDHQCRIGNVAMQKRFFDHYLKGIDNDWENEPPVEVEIRGPGDTVKRVARSTAWPLPETQWTRFFFDAANKTLSPHQSQERASALSLQRFAPSTPAVRK
jgi:predicted acyl esterase